MLLDSDDALRIVKADLANLVLTAKPEQKDVSDKRSISLSLSSISIHLPFVFSHCRKSDLISMVLKSYLNTF